MSAALLFAVFLAGWVARGIRDRARAESRRNNIEFSERAKAARKGA